MERRGSFRLLHIFRMLFSMHNDQTITVRVDPNAKSTKIKKTMSDGSLKIDVAAPADDGKANAELIRFLAGHFGVATSQIEILSGLASRRKTVRISD